MNVHRAAKDKGLKYKIVQHVRDYDQNHHIQRQIIRIQTGNQRSYIFRNQCVAKTNADNLFSRLAPSVAAGGWTEAAATGPVGGGPPAGAFSGITYSLVFWLARK